MKKHPALSILIFLLLLTSCQTADRSAGYTTDEELLLTSGLKGSIQQAILDTESAIFTREPLLSDVPDYIEYTTSLPGFTELMDAYLRELNEAVRSARFAVSDCLFSFLSDYTFENVSAVLESGYSSVSTILRNECHSEVTAIFEKALIDDSPEEREAFTEMYEEAEVWRKHHANLALVGQETVIAPISPLSEHELAVLAMEVYFNALSENEVRIRATGDTDAE